MAHQNLILFFLHIPSQPPAPNSFRVVWPKGKKLVLWGPRFAVPLQFTRVGTMWPSFLGFWMDWRRRRGRGRGTWAFRGLWCAGNWTAVRLAGEATRNGRVTMDRQLQFVGNGNVGVNGDSGMKSLDLWRWFKFVDAFRYPIEWVYSMVN